MDNDKYRELALKEAIKKAEGLESIECSMTNISDNETYETNLIKSKLFKKKAESDSSSFKESRKSCVTC